VAPSVNDQGSGAARARILAVDDEEIVRMMLARVLGEEGFEVIAASSAAEALEVVGTRPPDVVLLDVMLAGEDGLELLAELRRRNDVPVILLTAKGDESDRVLGLRLGADDYVVKPFSYPELAARITSVLRRTKARAPQGRRMAFGRLVIESGAREVFVDGNRITTTAKEFDLLAFLASSPRQVFSRQQLLQQVWESSQDWQDPATVTEHVRRLRHKIEDDPDDPKWIMTVRGVGYRFEG
jgi:two-component system, OmpR family, phosphate regulon response regulator PhoB